MSQNKKPIQQTFSNMLFRSMPEDKLRNNFEWSETPLFRSTINGLQLNLIPCDKPDCDLCPGCKPVLDYDEA